MDGETRSATMLASHFDIALQIAARLREHSTYGNEAKASAALRRRTGMASAEATAMMNMALHLYDQAVEVCAVHEVTLWASRTGGPLRVPAAVRGDLRLRAPGHSDECYDETLSWAFYTHHLR
jgi:hypothetical protein